MKTPDDFTGPLNLGSPQEITILELAQKILNITGSKSEIAFKPLPIDDPQQRKPDLRLAEEKLGWFPKMELEEGLAKTIYYLETLNDRRQ
jgi:UDP-glucuronate decarboxylase